MVPHYPQKSPEGEREIGEGEIVENLKNEISDDMGLSREEYNDIIQFLSRVSPELQENTTYLILSGYSEQDMRAARIVRDTINKEISAIAFIFSDLLDQSDNTHIKFLLIADLVENIVLIVDEASNFDVGFEMGEIFSNSIYFSKTHVLKRGSRDEITDESGLIGQFIEIVDKHDRLYCWESVSDLRQRVNNLPGVET